MSRRSAAARARRRGRPLIRPVPYGDAVEARVAEHGPTPSSLRSTAEWQYAADLAGAALTLDAARQFGLVTGGPTVNVDRCARILEQAERRRIEPDPAGVARALSAIVAEYAPRRDETAGEPTVSAAPALRPHDDDRRSPDPTAPL